MSPRRLSVLCISVAIVLPASALACLWDFDTLQMERNRSPSALELITGKFLRHTPEFYRWRIDDRLRKLKYEPDNLSYYDDLAVAYEKVGQRELALATIREKDTKKPGVYETESNLGTFLMLGGQLEEGLTRIEAALRINPDAHFGREKYQKYLAEYMICRRVDGKVPLPLSSDLKSNPSCICTSFAEFLGQSSPEQSLRKLGEKERQAAIRGVLGMMRFANHDSPVLLEVLGDLLRNRRAGDPNMDEKQLATRAYLKASYAVQDESARNDYREKARSALTFQSQYRNGSDELGLKELEASFQQELAQADAWFAEVRQNELTWLKEGKNPEEEFARQYYQEPQVEADPREELPDSPQFRRLQFGVIAILLLLVLLIAAVPVKIIQMRRARRNQTAVDPAKASPSADYRTMNYP
jgi:hypothetical protein